MVIEEKKLKVCVMSSECLAKEVSRMGRLDGRRGGEHPRRGARVSTELGAERFRGEGGRGRDVVLERREFMGGWFQDPHGHPSLRMPRRLRTWHSIWM